MNTNLFYENFINALRAAKVRAVMMRRAWLVFERADGLWGILPLEKAETLDWLVGDMVTVYP